MSADLVSQFAALTPRLKNVCKKQGLSHHDAEDILQEAVLDLLGNAPEIHTNPAGWLATMIRRRAKRDATQRRRRAAVSVGATWDLPEVQQPCPLEAAEAREQFWQAFCRLPSPERAVIELTLRQLSVREVATELSVPAATVARLRRSARRRLRILLSGFSDG